MPAEMKGHSSFGFQRPVSHPALVGLLPSSSSSAAASYRACFVKEPQETMREKSRWLIQLDQFLCLVEALSWAGGGSSLRCPAALAQVACVRSLHKSLSPPALGCRGRRAAGGGGALWRKVSAGFLESCPGFPAKKTNKK